MANLLEPGAGVVEEEKVVDAEGNESIDIGDFFADIGGDGLHDVDAGHGEDGFQILHSLDVLDLDEYDALFVQPAVVLIEFVSVIARKLILG